MTKRQSKILREDGRPSVCLCMIVKDEEHVIRRCIDSVRPLIDAWSIVDTGSTDGTQAVIRELLADVPGTLHERPWKDFGHNRTEALELAKPWADYALVIDADETLELPAGFTLPALKADAYLTPHRGSRSASSFYRVQLVKCSRPWHYVGVLHEVIMCDEPHHKDKLEGLLCVGHFDSARNKLDQRDKYLKDAKVLEQALAEEPDNARHVFYLAQSYRDAFEAERAIETYRRRAEMGGWAEEVFYSLYQVGLLCLGRERRSEGIAALLDAYQFRPTRREPLVELARHYRIEEKYELAHLFAKRAVAITRPEDILFLNDAAYTYRAEDELSIAAYWVGRYQESLDYANRVLAVSSLPSDQRPRVEKNRQFALDKLAAAKRTTTTVAKRRRKNDKKRRRKR